ncbi:hypothetical protein ACS0TY_017923 [Phlomoides rotata]
MKAIYLVLGVMVLFTEEFLEMERCLANTQKLFSTTLMSNVKYYIGHNDRCNICTGISSPWLFNAHYHCELKPSNVLLDEEMVSHVSDFGISKLLGDEQSTELTNTLATLGYITPEYGLEALVSTRCDVYSYGVMLMETFTRKRSNDDMFVGDLRLRSWV